MIIASCTLFFAPHREMSDDMLQTLGTASGESQVLIYHALYVLSNRPQKRNRKKKKEKGKPHDPARKGTQNERGRKGTGPKKIQVGPFPSPPPNPFALYQYRKSNPQPEQANRKRNNKEAVSFGLDHGVGLVLRGNSVGHALLGFDSVEMTGSNVSLGSTQGG